MSERIEIPVRIANVEQAIGELNRLNTTAVKGAQETKKELSEIDGLMRKKLGADVLSQGVNALAGSMKGTAGEAMNLLSVGIQGFGSAGPWGAAFAVATSAAGLIVEKLQEGREAALAFQQAGVDMMDALTRSAKQQNADTEEQTRLLEIERELRASGGDEAQAAAILASRVLDERVAAARQASDENEEAIARGATKALEAQETLRKLGSGSFLSTGDPERRRAAARAALDDQRKLEEQRVSLGAKLFTLELQKTAASERDRRESERRIAEERRKAIEKNAALQSLIVAANEQQEINATNKVWAAWEAANARKERLLRAQEDAEDAARGERVQAARDAATAEAVAASDARLAVDAREREEKARRDADQRAFEAQEREALQAIMAAPRLAFEEDAKRAFGAVAQGAGEAVASLAMYSAATRDANDANAVGAAEAMSNVAAQVQATLAGIAAESTVKAAFEAASAVASLATGNAVAASAHGIAAAKYAAIAGGAALGGAGIGSVRGETTQERQDREGSSTGTGSSIGGSRGSGGGSGSESGGVTLILNTGSGVWATRDELGRDMRMLLAQNERRR